MAFALGVGCATGQQIFQVAPGGAYPTVQAALAVANHGDILRVAAGVYPTFQCTKGVRIEGSPGAIVDCPTAGPPGGITISDIPLGSQCVLSGITMRRLFGSLLLDPTLRIRNSAGSVLVERVLPAAEYEGSRLLIENVSGGVILRDSAFINSRIVDSTVHLTGVGFRLSAYEAFPAVLDLENAEVVMVDGFLEHGWPYAPVACRLIDSRLELGVALGLSLTLLAPPMIPFFSIGAGSRVVQHSRVTPPDPVYSGGPWLRNDDPVALRVVPAPPGGVVALGLYVYGPAVPAVLFYGSQAPPSTLPFVDGPLALGASGLFGLPALVTPAWSTTPSAVAFGVPFAPALQGLPLVAQGFVYGGSVAPFRATNAVGFTLR